MNITRRAIKLANNNIQAECPAGILCRYDQITQGKMIRLDCSYLEDVISNDSGLHVQCRNLIPCRS